MVQALIKRLSMPISGLHKAAYVLAVLALGSQVLALLRDRLFAHTFGAGEVLDLYYAAFKIPDLIFAGVVTLVSAYVLVPKIMSVPAEKLRSLVSSTATFLTSVYLVAMIPLLLFLAPLLQLVFPHLYSVFGQQFVVFTGLLLIQPLVLGLSNIFGSVTQSRERFVLFALSPIVYNVGIILGLVLLYPYFGLYGIAYGVIIGSFLHLLINLLVLIEEQSLPTISFSQWSLIKEVVRDSFPRSLSMIAIAVTSIVLVAILAREGAGLVAVFTLASNIQAIPLSLVAVSYATAAFPLLSRTFAAKDFEQFQIAFLSAARHLIFWSVIIACLLLVLRAHIVRVILGSGAFDWGDTRLTAAVLALLSLALFMQGFLLLCARAWYAANRNWMPSLIQTVGAVGIIGSSLFLLTLHHNDTFFASFIEALFRVTDVEGTSVLMVALGVFLGNVCMVIATAVLMRPLVPSLIKELAQPLLHASAAGILAGAGAYGVLVVMGNIAPLTTFFAVLAQGVIAGMVGSIVAFIVLVGLDNQEVKIVLKALKKETALDIPSLPKTTD
jgi:putative peptidoglycan lipid II flippase